MARDKNPNKVKRSQVDDVFLATAKEVQDKAAKRRRDPLLALTDSQYRLRMAKAQEIVDKANARKAKRDGK